MFRVFGSMYLILIRLAAISIKSWAIVNSMLLRSMASVCCLCKSGFSFDSDFSFDEVSGSKQSISEQAPRACSEMDLSRLIDANHFDTLALICMFGGTVEIDMTAVADIHKVKGG